MFDPTVFENLKVVAEGSIYDWDLDGFIDITARKDIVDLANMERVYSTSFHLRSKSSRNVTGTFQLSFNARNWSGEVLEMNSLVPVCSVKVMFEGYISDVEPTCDLIQPILEKRWGEHRDIQQRLTFLYGKNKKDYRNEMVILFNKEIGEDQVDDLPIIIEHMVETLKELSPCINEGE